MRLLFDASDLVDDAAFENNPLLKETVARLAQEIAKGIDEKIKKDLIKLSKEKEKLSEPTNTPMS